MDTPGPLELIVIAVMVILTLVPLVGLGIGIFFIVRAIFKSGARENHEEK